MGSESGSYCSYLMLKLSTTWSESGTVVVEINLHSNTLCEVTVSYYY